MVGLAGVAALGLDEFLRVFFSTSSAKSSSAFCRCDGVVRFQSANALDAAAYALSMSASLDIGALAYSSPVLGSTSGMVAPLTESTSSPPMKF